MQTRSDVRPSILITEDDPFTRGLLVRCFENEGFLVEQATTGREMYEKLARRTPDLILLDKALPDEDGLVLLRQLRARSSVPVVMLSVHADDADRIAGLEMGADDYVSKFWKSEELVARVTSVIRRSRADASTFVEAKGRFLTFAGFKLDTEGHSLQDAEGREIDLTTHELGLLSALVKAKGRTLSRDQILDALSRGPDDGPQDRVVDVLISRLRTKLGDRERKVIRTVRNAGYQISDR
jgi:two-component system OmpR family response regulator